MGGCSALLTMKHNDKYESGLLQRLGFRKIINAGDREARGLWSIEGLLKMDPCCPLNCASAIGEQGCARLWGMYERASTREERDMVH